MAFIKSPRPTMSPRNAWRAGISNAFTMPRSAASTIISQTVTTRRSVITARMHARVIEVRLRGDHHVAAADAVGSHASERRENENRNLSGESDDPEKERRSGHAVDEPGLRHVLHPRADQGDELSAEEKLEIAMPQRAEHFGSLN